MRNASLVLRALAGSGDSGSHFLSRSQVCRAGAAVCRDSAGVLYVLSSQEGFT